MKRQNLFKLFACTLVLVLSISLLAGCGIAANVGLGAAAAVPLAISGSGLAPVPTNSAPAPAEQDAPVPAESATAPAEKNILTLEEAKAAALAALDIPDALFIAWETELDDGCYELTFVADHVEYEFSVDAFTGAVRKLEKEKERSSSPSAPSASPEAAENAPVSPAAESAGSVPQAPAAAKVIGREAALEAAAAHFGVALSDIRERDVERERGSYEVEFDAKGVEYECLVNAKTGEVSRAHSERDDDRYDD